MRLAVLLLATLIGCVPSAGGIRPRQTTADVVQQLGRPDAVGEIRARDQARYFTLDTAPADPWPDAVVVFYFRGPRLKVTFVADEVRESAPLSDDEWNTVAALVEMRERHQRHRRTP
jgi:hypothetical protein